MPDTAATFDDPLLGPWLKGFPPAAEPLKSSALGARGWHLLSGQLPFPIAVLKRSALEHNVAWLQDFVRERGLELAPHGKTTMSPQLFQRQLAAGAWGITFANVFQLRLGVVAGVRRAIIANQVQTEADLAGLARLLHETPGLRVLFLVDSLEQLAQIEAWRATRATAPVFEVLLEVGVAGGRTGVRLHDDALALAQRLRGSTAVRLVGIECYEGLGVTGDTATDDASAASLMARVSALATACDDAGLFEDDEVVISAGGSAIFDLVASRMRLNLRRPVRGVLRSGCYVTHDHGHYRRMLDQVVQRCGCSEGLRPALEVWTTVQSAPEPGLAFLTGGRRDLSFDMELPRPVAIARAGSTVVEATDPAWKITGLNDQHAHLRSNEGSAPAPRVGDRIALGISHPCTTFDKWHWMPIVDDDYCIVDAVTIHF
jgi:D-serine dehydratase